MPLSSLSISFDSPCPSILADEHHQKFGYFMQSVSWTVNLIQQTLELEYYKRMLRRGYAQFNLWSFICVSRDQISHHEMPTPWKLWRPTSSGCLAQTPHCGEELEDGRKVMTDGMIAREKQVRKWQARASNTGPDQPPSGRGFSTIPPRGHAATPVPAEEVVSSLL